MFEVSEGTRVQVLGTLWLLLPGYVWADVCWYPVAVAARVCVGRCLFGRGKRGRHLAWLGRRILLWKVWSQNVRCSHSMVEGCSGGCGPDSRDSTYGLGANVCEHGDEFI
jgi:hypothetical protein